MIFAATASDVSNVIVAGEHIVLDGAHRSIDVAAELRASITELGESRGR